MSSIALSSLAVQACLNRQTLNLAFWNTNRDNSYYYIFLLFQVIFHFCLVFDTVFPFDILTFPTNLPGLKESLRLCDQSVASPAHGTCRKPRQSEYVLSLLQRHICRDQGTAAFFCLHHKHQIRQSADDSVSCRKIACKRRLSGKLF